MIALTLWLAASVLVGWVAGRFIRAGATEHQPSACNQNCRQGRDCNCCTAEVEP